MEHLLIYNTLDSTNKEAQRLLSAGKVAHGTTVMTREQTEGRGQYGRMWKAETGKHLAMSIILKPQNLSVRDLAKVGMKTALGLVRSINQVDPNIRPLIKWPNDLYVGSKKLAGMLIENAIAGSFVQHIIIGIGMNVNETEFPSELPNPVSLKQLSGKENDLKEIAMLIRQQVMDSLEATDPEWKKEYEQLLFGCGQRFEFEHQGHTLLGEVKSVDDEGRMILALEDGVEKKFYSHELKWKFS